MDATVAGKKLEGSQKHHSSRQHLLKGFCCLKTTFDVNVAKIIGFQKQDAVTPQARRTALIQRAFESSDPSASENFKADKIGSKWSRFDALPTIECARIRAFQRTSNHQCPTQLRASDSLFRRWEQNLSTKHLSTHGTEFQSKKRLFL